MGYDDDGRYWGMNGMDSGGWLMMSVLILVCLAVVGVLVYVLLRASGTTQAGPAGPAGPTGQGSAAPPARSAAELMLDERFARGEIDQPEYQQRRTALRGG